MPRKKRMFTSLEAIPEISKDEQTRIWVGFYAAANLIIRQADDNVVQSLCDVVSANLGEAADEAIVRETLEGLN